MTFYSPDSDGMVAIPTALIPAQQEVINDAVMPLLFAGRPYTSVAVVLCKKCRSGTKGRLFLPEDRPTPIYQGTVRTTTRNLRSVRAHPSSIPAEGMPRRRVRWSLDDMYFVALEHPQTKNLRDLPSWCDDDGHGSVPIVELFGALYKFRQAGKVQTLRVAHRH